MSRAAGSHLCTSLVCSAARRYLPRRTLALVRGELTRVAVRRRRDSVNFVCNAPSTVTVYAQRDTGPETDAGSRTLLFRLSQATRDRSHIAIREAELLASRRAAPAFTHALTDSPPRGARLRSGRDRIPSNHVRVG